jgi:hypothetical protein
VTITDPHAVTADVDAPDVDPPVLVKRDRAAARSRDLVELMWRRPDLAGVYRPADVAAESVRWSA